VLSIGAIFHLLPVSPTVSVVKSEWTLFEQCVSDFSFLCPAPLRHFPFSLSFKQAFVFVVLSKYNMYV